MKREIKFRFWEEKSKTMIVWNCVRQTAFNRGDIHMMYDMMGTNPDIIKMQFTGLKDKNGTDIYEGDIIPMKISGRYGQVTFNDEILAGTVEYDATQARFIIVFPQPQKSGIVSTEFGWGDKDIEVAGNVFEHPHLLNKQ